MELFRDFEDQARSTVLWSRAFHRISFLILNKSNVMRLRIKLLFSEYYRPEFLTCLDAVNQQDHGQRCKSSRPPSFLLLRATAPVYIYITIKLLKNIRSSIPSLLI